MKTNRLYALAVKYGVTVDRFSMRNNGSASVFMDGGYYIAMDPALTGRCEKVSLAHEMGHCVTGSFYNVYAPLDIRRKHERRADLWAIKKLVPESKYKKALRRGVDNLFTLAEYFEVTPDFMKKAVDYYKKT